MSFLSKFPKETWIQRKQHQIWTFVLKASAPCQNIDISNVGYYTTKALRSVSNLVPRTFSLVWGRGPGNEVGLYQAKVTSSLAAIQRPGH